MDIENENLQSSVVSGFPIPGVLASSECGIDTYSDDMAMGPKELDGSAQWWDETGEYELGQILHWRWDPLAVASVFPCAADEYYNYSPTVAGALKAGASASQISELLATIEDDRIFGGGPAVTAPPVDRLRELGETIVAWYETSRRRWAELGPLPR